MITPQLENNYSKEELENILSALISIGIADVENEAPQKNILEDYSINFFSINEILLPYIHNYVCIKKNEIDLIRHSGKIINIYIDMVNLLLGSEQLCKLNISFTISYYDEERFLIQIEYDKICTSLIFRNKSEFVVFVSDAINTIFNIKNIDKVCFSITIVEDLCFLFINKISYCKIINERLLLINYIKYPEIEYWIESQKDEPLPF